MSDKAVELVFPAGEKERLDKFLTSKLPEMSRSRIQGLIKDGFISVNGIQAAKAGLDLNSGDRVQVLIPPPQPTALQPEPIPLQIIFENKNLMVINKPAGMVVHPAAGHATGTLVQAALAHSPDLEGVGGELRPGVVHRLDKETSGLIVMAKNDRTHRWLQEQFRLRKVKKVYLALADGQPPTPQGRIEAPIGRDLHNRKKMAVVPLQKGREAVTEYFVKESFPSHTLFEAHPLTGRTHQIRLHLAFIGCPIVGDRVYGRKKQSLEIKRHFLHAQYLTITLPGEKEPRTFEAPLPPELEAVLDELRKKHG